MEFELQPEFKALQQLFLTLPHYRLHERRLTYLRCPLHQLPLVNVASPEVEEGKEFDTFGFEFDVELSSASLVDDDALVERLIGDILGVC